MEAATRLEPDEVIGGRYRIIELLGEGGMGVVYRAEHTHMRKAFALKVLHKQLLSMPEVVSRFEREAVLAGSINHPNVAAATDFGKLADGSFFLVLELVIGKSLRELIAEGPVPIARALPIMRGMVAGIAAAHAKGIVHRDLKPDNVMLVERDGVSDFVKVLDFGIAKGDAMPEKSAEASAQPLTQIGTIMGTPAYMSPEQAVGTTVDARSDLYSLGIIFYELVTGAAPFEGDALQILRQHLTTEAPPIPAELVAGSNAPLAAIVKRLLAKEPDARFQTATDVLAALDAAPRAAIEVRVSAAEEPAAAAPAPAAPAAASEEDATLSARARKLAIGGASLGFMVLGAVLLAILFSHPDASAQSGADAAASDSAMPVSGLVAPPPSEVATTGATGSAAASTTITPTPLASADEDPEPESAPSAEPSSRAAAPAHTAAPPRARAAGGRETPAPRRATGFHIKSKFKELFQ